MGLTVWSCLFQNVGVASLELFDGFDCLELFDWYDCLELSVSKCWSCNFGVV